MAKYLFITSSSKNRIEFSVVKSLSDGISKMEANINSSVFEVKGFFSYVKVLLMAFRVDVIIFHTPLFSFYPLILLSHLLGRKVLGLVWDVYPVIINGRRYDSRIIRRIADFFENKSLPLLKLKIIPSSDFCEIGGDSVVFKFWPSIELNKIPNYIVCDSSHELLKIIFAGQINGTRGLELAFRHLKKIVEGNFTLYVASNDQLPSELTGEKSIIHVGFLGDSELKKIMIQCDFGLISLSPGFSGPAFPSKTFEYIKSDMPVLYYGPVLPSFIDTLESSGVGIDISKPIKINKSLAESASRNFKTKRSLFQNLTCLQDEDISQLVDIIERL